MFKRTQINLQKSHLWDIIWELSSNLDEIQEEVTESSNFKQPKLNIKQQLEQVRLQKKLEYNNYQSQQWDKISNDQDIYPPETCVVIGDLILNGIIEENLSKQRSGRIRKFPELLWMISIIIYIQSFTKSETHHYPQRNKLCYPFNI